MSKLIVLCCLLTLNTLIAFAQKKDTVFITSKNIDIKAIQEGTHRYLVYFKMNKDSVRTQTQFWTRTVQRTDFNGMPVIEINQVWEDKDSIMHIVKSVSDAKTGQPLFHKTWWKVQLSKTSSGKVINETIVDYIHHTVSYNGRILNENDTSKQAKAIWRGYKSSVDKYFLNWHLDLETFSILPYRKGTTFIIPFYDPGTASDYQLVTYTVTGSAKLTGYNKQQIDCWILVHEETGNKEVFWISKKTKEVLKLEQEINGRIYRYKIKLGFSM